jgi:hypothetical protein
MVLIVALVGSLASAAQQPDASAAAKPPAFPLKVSENHRFLVDQDGAPFLIVGENRTTGTRLQLRLCGCLLGSN